MYLKKVLNQPNLVGTMLIALMVCAGFVYAFAFDGFNIETVPGGEVEAWLAQANGGGSGGDPDPCDCGYTSCPTTKCRKKCGNPVRHLCSRKTCKTGKARRPHKCVNSGGCTWSPKGSPSYCSKAKKVCSPNGCTA